MCPILDLTPRPKLIESPCGQCQRLVEYISHPHHCAMVRIFEELILIMLNILFMPTIHSTKKSHHFNLSIKLNVVRIPIFVDVTLEK